MAEIRDRNEWEFRRILHAAKYRQLNFSIKTSTETWNEENRLKVSVVSVEPVLDNLQKHVKRVHEGKMRISCKECPLTFTTRNALKYHVTMIHQLKGKSIDETNISELCENPDVAEIIQKKLLKKIYCKVCEKYVFGRASHISEQHSEKNGKVKCPKCDKSFKTYNLSWFTFFFYLFFD